MDCLPWLFGRPTVPPVPPIDVAVLEVEAVEVSNPVCSDSILLLCVDSSVCFPNSDVSDDSDDSDVSCASGL